MTDCATAQPVETLEPQRSATPTSAVNRPFTPLQFHGVVMHGAKLGRSIGFPTANIALQGVRPELGIYAARVRLQDGRTRPGAAYFGSRPTVGGDGELLEVFIFDFSDDIYGAQLWVELIAFIRPDMTFPDLEAMKHQIARDCATAARVLDH